MKTVKSAIRVLDLLELMAALPSPLTLSQAARRLGIPKSSASALFSTLESKGYVTAGPQGYLLVEPFRRGGWTGGHFAHLTRVSRPVMMRLVEQTGESSFLGIMTSDRKVQYVDKITSTHPVRYDVDLTRIGPAYNTSIGHVFLAELSDDELEAYFSSEPLQQVTPYTETDPIKLRNVLAQVRARGYAEAERSNVLHSAGVAAPIRGADGRVIAGIAVIAPADRFGVLRRKAVSAVKAAAEEISDGLARIHAPESADTRAVPGRQR